MTKDRALSVRRRVSDFIWRAFWLAAGVYLVWLVLAGFGGPEDVAGLTDGSGWTNIPEWLR